jgi:hypothetical protein
MIVELLVGAMLAVTSTDARATRRNIPEDGILQDVGSSPFYFPLSCSFVLLINMFCSSFRLLSSSRNSGATISVQQRTSAVSVPVRVSLLLHHCLMSSHLQVQRCSPSYSSSRALIRLCSSTTSLLHIHPLSLPNLFRSIMAVKLLYPYSYFRLFYSLFCPTSFPTSPLFH